MAPRKKKTPEPDQQERRLVVYVPSTKHGVRNPDAEVDQRVGAVIKLLLEGEPYSEIVSKCSEWYGVCSRTTDRYIKAGNEKIREVMKHEIKSIASININYLRYTAKLAEKMGQPGVCVSAIKEINSMLGIGPDTITASDKFGNSITFNLTRRHNIDTEQVDGMGDDSIDVEIEEDNSDLPTGLIPL